MLHPIFQFLVSGRCCRRVGAFNDILAMFRPMTVTALVLCALIEVAPEPTWGEEWSLARDFSIDENHSESTWSYHLDDRENKIPVFPLLTRNDRDVNQIWGFETPPKSWSGDSGYWCIGKNDTGRELFSSRNTAKWPVGEVLLHPKGGDSPAGLVVGWTSPNDQVVDVRYSFQLASPQSRGIGYSILKRSDMGDTQIVALGNIGSGISNVLNRVAVAKGDRLFFRFDTAGNPGGDIVRAAVTVEGSPASTPKAPLPAGATVTAGSDVNFTAPGDGEGSFQWLKDGEPITGATTARLRIRNVKKADAGSYTVRVGSSTSDEAVLEVSPIIALPVPFASSTPKQVFSETLADQEAELKANELMLRFAASRKRLTSDPHRPAYHFVSPENMLNDPNGLCFWKGRWHLFYQAYPPDEFPQARDILKRRQHWGHAVSDDLIHWRDLPYAIYPGIERMCFSGSTVVEDRRVVAFYPGIGAGQMVATSHDDLLLNWKKLGGRPVKSPMGDSCIWKEGDTYYGLVGTNHLLSSTNLTDWTSNGAFIANNRFPLGDYSACPNFVPIGDKHILLSFSHKFGGQYMIGDYNRETHTFAPYERGLFNHGTVAPGGVHAPSAASDGKGGVINVLNINDGMYNENWDQLMSLPQHLTLGDDKRLRIRPVDAVTKLRGDKVSIEDTVIPANNELVLKQVRGNAMELEVEIDPKNARWVQLNVLRSTDAEEQTSITYYNYDRKLAYWYHTSGMICLDTTRSSTLPDAWMRPPDKTTFERRGQPLKFRVFVDRSVVEVFINERLYMAARVYPGREDSVGVSLRAQGQDAILNKLNAWQMNSIWTTGSDTK